MQTDRQYQDSLRELAMKEGAVEVGFTEIRRSEPVIILAFPYSDRWFFNFPITLTKRLGETYMLSKHVQNEVASKLNSDGFSAHYKTILSLYGDFRPLVVSAGLGEWGHNGLVVNKDHGSALLFAALFTTAPVGSSLEASMQQESHCTGCGHCIDACPAKAFQDGRFHLHRCLPYAIRGCSDCLCTGTNQ